MTKDYDPDNVFAKIIRGELPCHKVWEDGRTFAFLDINPKTKGHALVLPKASARNLLDCPPDDLTSTVMAVQLVARAAMKAFGADGVTILQNNETAGGQEVFHLHFHIIPQYAATQHGTMSTSQENLKKSADRLSSFLA